MYTILSTRQFVFVNAFRLFVSRHSDETSWGGIVYWDRQAGSLKDLDVLPKLQQFVGVSDDDVLQQARAWAENEYKSQIEFVEI